MTIRIALSPMVPPVATGVLAAGLAVFAVLAVTAKIAGAFLAGGVAGWVERIELFVIGLAVESPRYW